ncbi:asparagine synthase-related protein [Affinibrenneria salicis]|nr:asparagine synthase-related protein [Affinibrenneria salicis]
MLLIANKSFTDPILNFQYSNGWVFQANQFEVYTLDSNVYLLYGLISINGESITLEKYFEKFKSFTDFEKTLKYCEGFFCFIHISDSIKIITSLYCCIEIFFCKDDNGNIIISSDFGYLVSIVKDRTIDLDYCKLFVYNIEGLSEKTLLYGIKKIYSGSEYLIDKGCIVSRKVFYPKINDDFIGTSSRAIKNITSAFSNVNLYLSGGLDSTLLFFLLKDSSIDFTSFHVGPENEKIDSEINEFNHLCETYSIRGEILFTKRSQASYTDQREILNNPRYVKLYDVDVTNNADYISRVNNPKNIFISGHGGDSLFVQNPSTKIVRDCIVDFKPILALKKAYQLAGLKGRNFFDLILSSLTKRTSVTTIVDWMPLKDTHNITNHPWLKNVDKRTAKFDYIRELIVLITGSQISMSKSSFNLYPYLLNNVIASQIHLKYHEKFNGDFDRVHIRNQATKFFKCDFFYNKRKRSSSQQVYKIMNYNNKYISQVFFEDKVFLESIGVDFQKLLWSLSYNCNVSIQNDFECIIRLAKLVIYKKMFKEL